jgi:hypothetical protein
VVMRIARTPTRLWLDATGARLVTMAVPSLEVGGRLG